MTVMTGANKLSLAIDPRYQLAQLAQAQAYPQTTVAGVDIEVISKKSLKINLDACKTNYDQGVVLVIGGRNVAMDWSDFARLLGLEW